MRKAIFLLSLLLSLMSEANAQQFEITPSSFIETLNKNLILDNDGPLEGCVQKENTTECRFSDKGFDAIVQYFKKFNLMNGNFFNKNYIEIENYNGKVNIIMVSGDRSDPANSMIFVANIQLIMKTLSHTNLSTDELVSFADELGLTRGDSDPTIGTPKTIIKDFAQISCNAKPSSESTEIGCAFFPRY